MRRLLASCPRLLSTIIVDGMERPRHDPVHEIGLPRLKRNQPAEYVEEVQQVVGIFGEPGRRAEIFSSGEGGRLSPICGLVRSNLR